MIDNIVFEIFFLTVGLRVYLGIYYASNFLINNELKKKNTKRISNTKTHKTITRRGEEYDYEFPLNPNIDRFWFRFFAKLVDYGIYLGVFYYFNQLFAEVNLYPYVLAFIALFVINPIAETLTGRTLGKYIFGMRVIDDFGDNPSLIISFLKNFFQLVTIVFFILSQSELSDYEYEIFFHNKRTFTYTIWNKHKEKILTQLNK